MHSEVVLFMYMYLVLHGNQVRDNRGRDIHVHFSPSSVKAVCHMN